MLQVIIKTKAHFQSADEVLLSRGMLLIQENLVFWSMKAHFGRAQPGAQRLSRMTSKHKATSNRPWSQTHTHTHFHTHNLN